MTAQTFSPIKSQKTDKKIRNLKKWIWAYFILLILEGALRKWILPGLATPLLIIRDPIALWIVLVSWKEDLIKFNIYLAGIVMIGVVGFFTAIFLGHGNLFVALFGARMLLLHFPLIFIIGRIFDKEDVIQMGKVILWMSIPMAFLIVLQFYSPQSAWVNRGVGGDLNGAGFNGGALGYYRPPGTFSFTNGNTFFYSLVASFVFYFWIDPKKINRFLLIMSSISLFAAIPISISRSLFFQVAISLFFAIIALVRNPKYLGRLFIAAVSCVVVLILLQKVPFFSTAIEAFSVRFTNASDYEGGLRGTLVDRFLGGMLGSTTDLRTIPFFGYGLGMGTNVGSQLLTGNVGFLIAEEEWPRIIGELGLLLGILIILIRIGLTLKITVVCYRKLRQEEFLPWMILSFEIIILLKGGWAQPTSLGFFTLGGGLVLAALNNRKKPKYLNRSRITAAQSLRRLGMGTESE